MIGQVISQSVGLSLQSTGGSLRTPEIEEVSSEEKSQSHNQAFYTKRPEVSLSETALELSQSDPGAEPNWKQVQAMAGQLSSSMDTVFLKAGIDTSQPIRINIHPFTGIPFVGEHPDKGRIQRLLDDTPDILQQIKNVNSVASFSYQASQASHGVPSSVGRTQSISQSMTGQISGTRLQSALGLYEQASQATRISMEYKKDVGITLDVINSSSPR